jgi:hypothetical protein
MRVLLLTLLLTACTTGDWQDYNYGPADWLTENGYGDWDTMYNYEHFVEPEIFVWRDVNMREYCGSHYASGCAVLKDDRCDVFLGSQSLDTYYHELRHCHGWDHHRIDFRGWAFRDSGHKERELARAKLWRPMEQYSGL